MNTALSKQTQEQMMEILMSEKDTLTIQTALSKAKEKWEKKAFS